MNSQRIIIFIIIARKLIYLLFYIIILDVHKCKSDIRMIKSLQAHLTKCRHPYLSLMHASKIAMMTVYMEQSNTLLVYIF